MNKSVWTIETEFTNLQYNTIGLDKLFIKFINKWIQIMLLRDNEFFKSKLSPKLYKEFIEKINKYKNINGADIKNISLYFTEYNFTQDLENKLLDIRNYYGMILFCLLIVPHENNIFNSLSKNIKKIKNNFNIHSILQEVTFDLGCSSYALGKFYDYLMKMYDDKDILLSHEYEFICSMIYKCSHDYIKNYNLENIDNEQINLVNEKKITFLPLGFNMNNDTLIFFLKNFF
jgi:hypothetical protein